MTKIKYFNIRPIVKFLLILILGVSNQSRASNFSENEFLNSSLKPISPRTPTTLEVLENNGEKIIVSREQKKSSKYRDRKSNKQTSSPQPPKKRSLSDVNRSDQETKNQDMERKKKKLSESKADILKEKNNNGNQISSPQSSKKRSLSDANLSEEKDKNPEPQDQDMKRKNKKLSRSKSGVSKEDFSYKDNVLSIEQTSLPLPNYHNPFFNLDQKDTIAPPTGNNNTYGILVKQIMHKQPTSNTKKHSIHNYIDGKTKTEDKYGSRCFVQRFEKIEAEDTEKEIIKWHKSKAKVIENTFRLNNGGYKINGKLDSNFVVARFTFMDKDKKRLGNPIDLPYIFSSGWPNKEAKETKKPLNFSKKLAPIDSNSKPSKNLKRYGLHYPTARYEEGKETPLNKWDDIQWFRNHLRQILDKSIENDSLVSEYRLKYHSDFVKNQRNSIAENFFHSEQTLLLCIEKTFSTFREKNEGIPEGVKYLILDIVSYYDLCWGCGDTLASFCKVFSLPNWRGYPILIRASGLNAYSDRVFDGEKKYTLSSLRGTEKELQCTSKNICQTISFRDEQIIDHVPYINHTIAERYNKRGIARW